MLVVDVGASPLKVLVLNYMVFSKFDKKCDRYLIKLVEAVHCCKTKWSSQHASNMRSWLISFNFFIDQTYENSF